jgi:hypothetical protein
MIDYESFLAQKLIASQPSGFTVDDDKLSKHAFDYQRAIVKWACYRGKAAIFARYGTGKTIIQLDWAHQVANHTDGNVLIVAPLAVAKQTEREGIKFGLPVTLCRSQSDVAPGVNITNYEMLHKFDPRIFSGVVLDESSILKHIDSSTRGLLLDWFQMTPYKLCCTATPSPNDYTELGGHSAFLNVMSASEMLSTFFYHDGGDTSKWTLMHHARDQFWKWVSSWAVMMRTPADLGFDASRYTLPALNMHEITVQSDDATEGYLFAMEALTLTDRRTARRGSLEDRVKAAAELANNSTDQWLIWCNLNDESAALKAAINGAVEVKGADSTDHKERSMMGFVDGSIRVLVSKPSICGFGMNFQNCHNMAFVGLSDSFEEMDQAIHRCHRFGQVSDVDCYVIVSSQEGSVVRNIQRKRESNQQMSDELAAHVAVNLDIAESARPTYHANSNLIVPAWLVSEEY